MPRLDSAPERSVGVFGREGRAGRLLKSPLDGGRCWVCCERAGDL